MPSNLILCLFPMFHFRESAQRSGSFVLFITSDEILANDCIRGLVPTLVFDRGRPTELRKHNGLVSGYCWTREPGGYSSDHDGRIRVLRKSGLAGLRARLCLWPGPQDATEQSHRVGGEIPKITRQWASDRGRDSVAATDMNQTIRLGTFNREFLKWLNPLVDNYKKFIRTKRYSRK